jgi:hypothetical protein
MKEFALFLKAVFWRWQSWAGGSGIGGAIVVLMALWDKLVPQHAIANRTYVVVTIIGFLFGAFFLAWRDQYRAKIRSNAEIEQLTWPTDRPKLSVSMWGQREPTFMPRDNPQDFSLLSQFGFYLSNDGEAALDVMVEKFKVGDTYYAYGDPISRIAGKTKGFIPIRIDIENPLLRFNLNLALKEAWTQALDAGKLQITEPLLIPISVIYRDHNQLWYRTHAALVFANYLNAEGGEIMFRPSKTDRLGSARPESFSYDIKIRDLVQQ